MQTKLPTAPDTQSEDSARIRDRIEMQVIHKLGRPASFQSVQVRRLWDHHFRVNVLIGADAASVSIAHSFFLEADSSGNIVSTIPALARCYQPIGA